MFAADRARIAQLNQRELELFTARTGKSRALLNRARKVMPAGTPMSWMAGYYMHPQLYVAGGKGSRFYDADGNSYVDMNVADLSATLGYGIPAVEKAMVRQFRNADATEDPGWKASARSSALLRSRPHRHGTSRCGRISARTVWYVP